MKSKKLFLIIYISIIFSCTNSHGVNQSFAITHLKEKLKLYQFINADMIADGLFPLNAEKHSLEASKLFIKD